MKKIILGFFFGSIIFMSCTDKKKTAVLKEESEKAKVELQQVEEVLDNISNEVKSKSKELDEALDALDNL